MGCMPYLFLQMKCSAALRSKKSRSSTENSECELRVCFKVCEDELKFGGSRMWWEGDHIDLRHIDTERSLSSQHVNIFIKIVCSLFCDVSL